MGKDLREEFKKILVEIERILDIVSVISLVIEVFGVKVGFDLVDVIKGGCFSY